MIDDDNADTITSPTARSTDRSAFPVTPFARVVPNGIVERDGKTILQATVVMTPNPYPMPVPGQPTDETSPSSYTDSSKTPFSLDQWPSQILRAMESKRTFVDRLLKDDGTFLTIDTVQTDYTIPLRFARSSKTGECGPLVMGAFSKPAKAVGIRNLMENGGANAIKDVQDLWTKTFTSNYPQPAKQRTALGWWTALSDVLRDSMGAKSYMASQKLKTEAEDPPKDDEVALTDSDAKVKVDVTTGGEREVDAIFTQSHADMAVALEYGRVRKTLDALKMMEDDEVAAPNTPSPQARSTDAEAEKRVSSLTEDKVKVLIQDERNKERKKAYVELKDNFAAGKEVFKKTLKNLESATCGSSIATDPMKTRPSAAQMLANEATNEQCLQDGKNIQTYSVVAMKADQKILQQNPELQEAREKAGQTYFAVQSTPAIARLYCLAFDVEVALDPVEVDALFGSATAKSTVISISVHDEENRVLGVVPRTPSPWSVTKLARNAAGTLSTAAGNFWPISRDEKIARQIGDASGGAARHIDGYIAVGECWNTGDGGYIPRFDLTSLNIRAAVEHESVLERAAQEGNSSLLLKKNEKTSKLGVHAKSFQTAGLAVVDRGVQRESAMALARRQHEGDMFNRPLLHAEDLTVALRMDVGVPGEKPGDAARWRPMHLRNVNYGDKASNNRYSRIADKLLPLVAGKFKTPSRLTLDASTITSPEQIVPKQESSRKVDLVTAENIITWEGAPLGVETLRPIKKQGGKKNENIEAEEALPFGRALSLPEGVENNALSPPRLRFGWPYSFAFRTVFSGGKSIGFGSLDDEDVTTRAKLSFPGLCDEEGGHKPAFFRFLRQKSIDPPVLVMPLAEGLKDHGAMGYQNTAEMVVRTVENAEDAGTRSGPISTSRVILPPFMAMDEVARHGSLDRPLDPKFPDQPEGAISSFRWHQVRNGSGFRSFKTESILGFNGAWVLLKPRTKANLKKPDVIKPLEKEEKRNQRRRISQTTPVFEKHDAASDDKKDIPYYPDPFAQTLVISARHAGTSKRLGAPYLIGIYKKGQSAGLKPDPREALPIIITTRAGAPLTTPADLTTAKMVENLRFVSLDDAGMPERDTSELAAEARELVLAIPQGISIELDLWFIPSEQALARQSALLQAASVYGLMEKKPPDFDITDQKAVDKACRDWLMDFDKTAPKMTVEERKAPFPESLKDRYFTLAAPGGLPVPSEDVLMDVAKVFTKYLRTRPVTQIAAMTTLTCIHASDSVDAAPQLLSPVFHKASLEAVKAARKLLTEKANNGAPASMPSVTVEDESTTLIDGTLVVDLNLISGFDLIAEAENPTTSVFDNADRKRDLGAVRAGQWPVISDFEGKSYIKTSQHLFGFKVHEDGTVDLPRGKVALFKVRNLPTNFSGPSVPDTRFSFKDGKAHLPLFDLLHDENSRRKYMPDAIVSEQRMFDDCLGRNVRLSIRMIPRSLAQLKTKDRMVDGKHVVAQAYPQGAIAEKLLGDEGLLLPSSRRPSELPSVSNGFFFIWHGDDGPVAEDSDVRREILRKTTVASDAKVWRVTRKPVNRLSVGRNFFSATSNEKFAIILWPPNLLEQKYLGEEGQHNPNRNVVDLQPAINDPARRLAQLDDFHDDDLGLGGQFITRLGADPVRAERYSGRAFLDRQAFRPDPNLRHRIRDKDGAWSKTYAPSQIVEHARIPLTGKIEDNATAANGEPSVNANEDTALQFMSVALMLYEPRFDPETERWFADIELTDASDFAEPFLRLGVTRHDPHGERDLATAYPATVWSKILPRRDATIVFSANGKTLDVTLEGPKTDIVLNTSNKGKHTQERVQVFARLMRESKSNGSIGLRQAIDLEQWPKRADVEQFKDNSLPVRSPRDMGGMWHKMDHRNPGAINGHWTLSCDLDLETPLQSGESLVLYMEEVEHYRPATYNNEPVNPAMFEPNAKGQKNNDDYTIESGPKFACRVVIEEG